MSQKLVQTVGDELPATSQKGVIGPHLPQRIFDRYRLLA